MSLYIDATRNVENILNFVHGTKDYNSVGNMQATNSALTTTTRKNQMTYGYHLSFEHESIIGVYDRERSIPQKIIFDIKIKFKNHKITTKENFDLLIKTCVTNSSKKLRSKLLEHMAYSIGTFIIDSIPAIDSLSITIKKPAALHNARCSYVTLSIR